MPEWPGGGGETSEENAADDRMLSETTTGIVVSPSSRVEPRHRSSAYQPQSR